MSNTTEKHPGLQKLLDKVDALGRDARAIQTENGQLRKRLIEAETYIGFLEQTYRDMAGHNQLPPLESYHWYRKYHKIPSVQPVQPEHTELLPV